MQSTACFKCFFCFLRSPKKCLLPAHHHQSYCCQHQALPSRLLTCRSFNSAIHQSTYLIHSAQLLLLKHFVVPNVLWLLMLHNALLISPVACPLCTQGKWIKREMIQLTQTVEDSWFSPFIFSLWLTSLISQSILFHFSFSFSLGLEDLNGSPSVKGRIFLTCPLTFEHSPEDFPSLQNCPLRVTGEKQFSSAWSIP